MAAMVFPRSTCSAMKHLQMAKKVTAKQPDDFDVIVPLSKLMGLLDAAQRVDDLTQEVGLLREQYGALKGQFLEVMEMVRGL